MYSERLAMLRRDKEIAIDARREVSSAKGDSIQFRDKINGAKSSVDSGFYTNKVGELKDSMDQLNNGATYKFSNIQSSIGVLISKIETEIQEEIERILAAERAAMAAAQNS